MREWQVRVKSLFKSAGITYPEIGAAMGITAGAVGHYLNGRREPSVKQLKQMARLLGMTIGEMIGDEAYFLDDPLDKEIVDATKSLNDDQKRAILELIKQIHPTPAE